MHVVVQLCFSSIGALLDITWSAESCEQKSNDDIPLKEWALVCFEWSGAAAPVAGPHVDAAPVTSMEPASTLPPIRHVI